MHVILTNTIQATVSPEIKKLRVKILLFWMLTIKIKISWFQMLLSTILLAGNLLRYSEEKKKIKYNSSFQFILFKNIKFCSVCYAQNVILWSHWKSLLFWVNLWNKMYQTNKIINNSITNYMIPGQPLQ